MANARGKSIDKTFLSIEQAEDRGFIHRDYVAHCLRWTHVMKRMNERKAWASARLLDIGCGRELPLPKTLFSSRFIVEQYYGVDVGPINDSALEVFASGKFPIQCWEKTNLLDLTLEDLGGQQVNWATCFEVLEHVEPQMMIAMLRHVRDLMTPGGTFFVSTPCWDRVNCAANHVNEMTHDALGAVIEGTGWTIKNVYGTFASIKDYEAKLRPEQKILFNCLREYYDTNFLSCVFAPLFPRESRNCLWELTPHIVGTLTNRYPHIYDCEQPWGSSLKWKEMADF